MIRRILFIIIVIVQVGFLLGMIKVQQKKINTGFPVRLPVQRIDTKDLVRGESVRLEYDISNLDLNKIPHDLGVYQRSSTVYIILSRDTAPNSPLWIPESIHQNRPLASDFPFIKGRVIRHKQWSDPSTKFNKVTMDYSIGHYFVQEGRGREIQSAINSWDETTVRRVSVGIRLAKNGTPVIAKLYIDNNEFR